MDYFFKCAQTKFAQKPIKSTTTNLCVPKSQIIKSDLNHTSWIGNQLYFQGRDGVLRRAIGKRDTSRLLYEFHDGFCGGHFAGRITAEKILLWNHLV
jgi:hypothetical protein